MTLAEIEAEVNRWAAVIGAAGHRELPTYGHSEDMARPHIEVDSRGYHFVVVERGREWSRITTLDLDELLYCTFQHVTSCLAYEYELRHRIEMQDCRRMAFQRQEELLSLLSVQWATRRAGEHRLILQKHPFDDYAFVRATLTAELRKTGHSPDTAWRMACERYPLLGAS